MSKQAKGPREEPLSPALRYFLECVERGRGPSVELGPVTCRELADTIAAHAPYLDSSMLDGLIEFARIAQADRRKARALIGL